MQFFELLADIVGKENIEINAQMQGHTTFKVGGPADVLCYPDRENLSKVMDLCRKKSMPVFILGNGSNLLVGDKGIRGVVISTKHMDAITLSGKTVYAQAGALLSKVAHKAADASLKGMEFAAGIPGSIGGAVVMNAGAYGGEMKQIIESVDVLDSQGQEKTLSLEELELGYRTSCILKNNYIVLGAKLKLETGDIEEINKLMDELRAKRVEKQPLNYPSAGSTFKRPEGYFAGKLIDDAGLRGFTVGGAQVSEKHCGFVINKDHATAADIVSLMQQVSDKVQAAYGVALEPEVKMIGEF